MITPTNTTHTAAANQTKRSSKPSAQSLNHLLNFTLPPRQTHYNQGIPRRARKTGGHHNVWNKEREYIHLTLILIVFLTSQAFLAHCRFCERAVPFCYEPKWRLHCAFRRS